MYRRFKRRNEERVTVPFSRKKREQENPWKKTAKEVRKMTKQNGKTFNWPEWEKKQPQTLNTELDKLFCTLVDCARKLTQKSTNPFTVEMRNENEDETTEIQKKKQTKRAMPKRKENKCYKWWWKMVPVYVLQ